MKIGHKFQKVENEKWKNDLGWVSEFPFYVQPTAVKSMISYTILMFVKNGLDQY